MKIISKVISYWSKLVVSIQLPSPTSPQSGQPEPQKLVLFFDFIVCIHLDLGCKWQESHLNHLKKKKVHVTKLPNVRVELTLWLNGLTIINTLSLSCIHTHTLSFCLILLALVSLLYSLPHIRRQSYSSQGKGNRTGFKSASSQVRIV